MGLLSWIKEFIHPSPKTWQPNWSSGDLDLFISYKSEDAAKARLLAEGLMACGLKVWMAEYNVLMHNYDDFQQAIDDGIDRSKFALFLTSTAWAHSIHVQREVARVLARIPANRILTISTQPSAAPDELFAEIVRRLKGCPPELSWAEADILPLDISSPKQPDPKSIPVATTKWLGAVMACKWTQRQMGVEETEIPERTFWQGETTTALLAIRYGWRLCAGSLMQWKPPAYALHRMKGYAGYFSTTADTDEVRMWIMVGSQRVLPSVEGVTDDRQLYGLYREHAEEFFRRHRHHSVGLHLLDYNNQSHFASTTIEPHASDRSLELWTRRYVVSRSRRSDAGEIDVTFAVHLPKADRDAAFQTFCSYAVYMHDMIQTLRRDSATAEDRQIAYTGYVPS